MHTAPELLVYFLCVNITVSSSHAYNIAGTAIPLFFLHCSFYYANGMFKLVKCLLFLSSIFTLKETWRRCATSYAVPYKVQCAEVRRLSS